MLARAAAASIALASLAACAYRPPMPPMGRPPADEMIEVPYPPPPARVEVIPPQKDSEQVWLDGQWNWNGRAWKWFDGSWVTPPPDAYFSPWTLARKSDGRLFFARATWRGRDGRALPFGPGPDACPAPTPPAPTTIAKQ